ncbi:acyltransferase [Haloechinothrix sp. LS1_15]|uniref:acyltransferase n=1 Tax=Haloechinothrix sp. LS1_15 TaxID=2652248 RepID=UPI002945C0AA|nr:acyltransferase [Haloechinothrix sp. LS1_15]MDV6012360.1 acyltransferase [Haloechinothrix sp. LS1_15]
MTGEDFAAAFHGEHGIPPNPYNTHARITGDPVIGEGTWIGAFTVLDGGGGLLRIGTGCDIGVGSQIYTHSTMKRCVSGRAYNTVDTEPVSIGDHVFIAPNVTILPGVSVGDSAAIVAGSVVTSDVAARSIVAGVPARPIGHLEIDGADVRPVYYASSPDRQE